MALPNYIDGLHHFFPEDRVELFTQMEKSFELINYDLHKDDIDHVFAYPRSNGSKDLANIITSLYCEHMDTVLTAQGVFLSNPFTDPLQYTAKILQCICLLGTHALSDILEGTTLEETDSGDVYLAEIISHMTNYDVSHLLQYIKYVTPEVVDYLKQDLPLESIREETGLYAEARFKSSPIPKVGVIVDAIRSLNYFGYSTRTFMMTHSHAIAEWGKDLEMVANEIILMVLGSSTPNHLLRGTMLEAAEHIVDNSQQLIQLNQLISTYMEANKEVYG